MSSTFTWLDYSEEARRRVLDTIDLFRQRDTREELGLGSIRDGFAALFSPGSSTIQTRARYFLLIPWLYQSVERRRSGKPASVRARLAELDLIESLLAGGDHIGLIGRDARHNLKRLPSNIYWQGLQAWGIRQVPVSQDAYHRWIDRGVATPVDTSEEGEPVHGIWHAGLPAPPADFPDAASLSLPAEEADYLAERLLQRWPGSMLAWLVRDQEPVEPVTFPWDHPGVARMPAHIREQLDHARCFSEVIHGAQLLYNLMLARKLSDGQHSHAVEGWEAAIDQWEAMIVARDDVLDVWDVPRFWEILDASGTRVTPWTREFVGRWIERVLSGDAPQIARDHDCAERIEAQEVRVKGQQARLINRSMLESWGGDSGSAQLDYRWGITRTYAAEIAEPRGA